MVPLSQTATAYKMKEFIELAKDPGMDFEAQNFIMGFHGGQLAGAPTLIELLKDRSNLMIDDVEFFQDFMLTFIRQGYCYDFESMGKFFKHFLAFAEYKTELSDHFFHRGY